MPALPTLFKAQFPKSENMAGVKDCIQFINDGINETLKVFIPRSIGGTVYS